MQGEISPVRIIIADDHVLVREGIQAMLESEPDLEVIGEAADGREALELCRELCPDLVLMDVRMPVMDGLTSMRNCKTLEVRFRALLSQDETRQLEVVRA